MDGVLYVKERVQLLALRAAIVAENVVSICDKYILLAWIPLLNESVADYGFKPNDSYISQNYS